MPRCLALATTYAGQLQRKCAADSMSPHSLQRGLLDRPIVCRCLFKGQWPVRMPVSRLILFLLSEVRNFVFLGFSERQFLECELIPIEVQCLVKASLFYSLITCFLSDAETFIPGSGPNSCESEPTLARLSAISFPSRPLWPGIQISLTGL